MHATPFWLMVSVRLRRQSSSEANQAPALLGCKVPLHSVAASSMATSPRIRNTPGCEIELQGEHLRVAVGPALSDEVQDCYHAFANECVTRTCNRVLIIGNAKF